MGRDRALLRRLIGSAAIHAEERALAGAASGALFLLGAVTLTAMTTLTSFAPRHHALLLALAAGAALFGACSVAVLRWLITPVWLVHVANLLSFGMVIAVVASSGAAASPAWVYVLFPAFFAVYFYGQPVATAYLLACVAVQALPLLYDRTHAHTAFLAQLIIAGPSYVTIGLAVNAGKRRAWRLRARAEMLAAEQGALRRVATAVVDGQTPDRIYKMVAEEVAGLAHSTGSGILRLEGPESLVVVGAKGDHQGGAYRAGTTLPVLPGSDISRALREERPVRIDCHPADAPVAKLGYHSTIIAPVKVGEHTWGLLAVAGEQPYAFTAEDEQTLLDFGQLLATAIASTEERARLAEQALTDSLTGLANQRALHARLEAELARSARHDAPLSVAMIDIDHFKEVNDTAGHEAGDEMLVRVSAALMSFARTEDLLGRVGGDEFAWILPDTTREQAMVAVERARRLIAEAPADPQRITISAGISDTQSSTDASELLRLADSALYWSKAHGRNQSWIYDPTVVVELSERQRVEQLERAQALAGLRTLVQTRESRDLVTRDHSARVAEVAVKLAGQAGWPHDRALALGEAASLHDLGIVAAAAVPVASGPVLEPATIDRLRELAALSAQMAEGVLSAEQVTWIQGQYAASGATEDEVGGASLLALADAWDRMTAVAPGLPTQALVECERHTGVWFDRRAVEALRALLAAGELGDGRPFEDLEGTDQVEA